MDTTDRESVTCQLLIGVRRLIHVAACDCLHQAMRIVNSPEDLSGCKYINNPSNTNRFRYQRDVQQ